MRRMLTALISIGVVSFTAAAHAQAPAPAPTPAPAPLPAAEPAPVPAPAPAPLPPPPPPPPPVAAATTTTSATTDNETDHSKVVGRMGIGYFGQFDIPLGYSSGAGTTVPTQLVGVRYWFQEKVGIDIGLGVGLASGSDTNAGLSTDRASSLAFALKGGVPISLYDGKHYSFIIEPQAFFGHAGLTRKAPPTAGGPGAQADTTLNGNRFMAGVAAGAIVHFGFIGIPQLTLDATVGAGIDLRGGSTKAPPGAGGPTTTNETSYSTFSLATMAGHQPWNIFHTNVAAIYHF